MDDGLVLRLRKLSMASSKQLVLARLSTQCSVSARDTPSTVDPVLFLRDSAAGDVAIIMRVDETAGTGPQGEIDKDIAALARGLNAATSLRYNVSSFSHSACMGHDSEDYRFESTSNDSILPGAPWMLTIDRSQGIQPVGSDQMLARGSIRTDRSQGLHHYAVIVGGLLYLACATQSDLAASASALCRYMSTPMLENLDAARRVCRYLAGAFDNRLVLGGFSPDQAIVSTFS
jgi:hypothetical protein